MGRLYDSGVLGLGHIQKLQDTGLRGMEFDTPDYYKRLSCTCQTPNALQK